MDKQTSNFWQRNGLSLVLIGFMLLSLAGQVWTGWRVDNAERIEAGGLPQALAAYLASGHFISATFENWESEFLQMGMYVLLTVKLRQRGSAESRPLDPAQEHERIERGPRPWPVRRGGLWRAFYGHSLAIAFAVLFAASFALHLRGSWLHQNVQRALHGDAAIGIADHLASAQFWFESFQNWQSEFFAVLALVVLSIWLRQKDSTQSKPLEAPHSQTGV